MRRSARRCCSSNTRSRPVIRQGAMSGVLSKTRTGRPGRRLHSRSKPDHPLRLSLSFIDRNGVAYTAWKDLKGGEWQAVRIPIDEIRPNPVLPTAWCKDRRADRCERGQDDRVRSAGQGGRPIADQRHVRVAITSLLAPEQGGEWWDSIDVERLPVKEPRSGWRGRFFHSENQLRSCRPTPGIRSRP